MGVSPPASVLDTNCHLRGGDYHRIGAYHHLRGGNHHRFGACSHLRGSYHHRFGACRHLRGDCHRQFGAHHHRIGAKWAPHCAQPRLAGNNAQYFLHFGQNTNLIGRKIAGLTRLSATWISLSEGIRDEFLSKSYRKGAF